MSQENVEIVRAMAEALLVAPETIGYEAVVDGLDLAPIHPEVEWDPRQVSEIFGVPDIGQVYVGIAGGKAFWSEWLSAWETVEFKYELIEAGDRVVVLLDQQMKGRTTGIEVRLGKYAQVCSFRDGLLIHWKCYADQTEALEAVGLSG